LTRGTQLAGPEAMQASDIGVQWLGWCRCGGTNRDMDPIGATPHWRRRSRRQRLFSAAATRRPLDCFVGQCFSFSSLSVVKG